MNCESAQESSDISDGINKIFITCCRLMQMPVYYDVMRSMFFSERGEKENARMSFLAGKFQMNAESTLGNACKINVLHCDTCTIGVPEEFLLFLLISFVRRAVIDGAKTINMRFHSVSDRTSDNLLTPPERYAVIFLEASDFGKINYELADDFVYEHFDDIVRLFEEKYGAEYELTKEMFKLKLPVLSADEELFAHSQRKQIGQSGLYTLYNVYLHELNPDAYI